MGMKTIAAGNGSSGSESHMLSSPRGIYVNLYFNLYVADCGNNRIQLFPTGQLIGTTLTQNVPLNCPTGIVSDADDYLFIVDSNHHRIIEVRPNGFRCLLGCSGVAGSLPNQLNFPQSMAFDSYGNIFVSDRSNNRIQVFNLATNSCGKHIEYCF
jgi:DNA-binding beta-propeller fold protein YncE